MQEYKSKVIGMLNDRNNVLLFVLRMCSNSCMMEWFVFGFQDKYKTSSQTFNSQFDGGSCVKLSPALTQLCVFVCLQTATSRSSVIPSPRKHTCSQCGSSFSRLHFLNLHEAAHKGCYPYWCEICGKGSLNTSNLRRHMATHSGKTDHSCTLCRQSFRYFSSLKRHVEHCHKDTILE